MKDFTLRQWNGVTLYEPVDLLFDPPQTRHSKLCKAALLTLNRISGCDFSQLTQWSGTTDRGTCLKAGLTTGAFDLIGTVDGRRVDLEAKTGKGKPSDEQKAWQKRIRRAGGVAEVFHSVQEAVEIVLKIKSERT